MIELTGQWALWSKEPGDSREYRVLVCSGGPLTEDELGRLILGHIPAAPPGSRLPGPAALPWVTVSPAWSADGPGLGIAVLDLSAAIDSAGRRVAPTLYVRVPFRALAEGGVGYAELAAAVLDVELPEGEPAALCLGVEPLAASEVAAIIDAIGFQRLAAVAGLLLEGRVVLRAERPPERGDRVATLDAVAALLPFGFRTDLTVSTWADQDSDQIRLGFGQDAASPARAIPWDGGGVPGVAGGPPRDYAELLLQLHHDHGTERLVSHLARDVVPRRFSNPAEALDSLRQLDRVRGPGRAGHLHGQRGRPGIARLEQEWTPELWPELVDLAGAELLSADSRLRDSCVDLATRHGVLERLLVELLDWPRARPGSVTLATQEAAAIGLVRSRLDEAWRAAGSRDLWPELARSLSQRPDLAHELLAQEIAAGGIHRLPVLLTWLERAAGDAPAGLRAFRVALGQAQWPGLSEGDLRAVAPRHAWALFDLARQQGLADDSLTGVWAWLVDALDGLDGEQRQRWLQGMEQMAATGPPEPRVRARLDLLALMVDAPARVSLRERLAADRYAAGAYLAAFRELYLSARLDRPRGRVASHLVAIVDGQPWASTAALADRVLALLEMVWDRALPGDEIRTAVLRVVGRGAVTGGDILDLPRYRGRWAPLVEADPEIAAALAVSRLRADLSADLPVDRMAALAAAVADRQGPDLLVATLAAAAHPLRADTVYAFLVAVGAQLRRRRRSPADVGSIQTTIVQGILDGRLGASLASEFRAWLTEELPADMLVATRLVAMHLPGHLRPDQLEVLRAAEGNLAAVTGERGRLGGIRLPRLGVPKR